MAHNGTIFLDEISEIDKSSQARLLRVLQERQVRRIGGDYVIPVDVRIIAATNTNLYKMVKDNTFRRDLFYRLNVLILNIPALRDRDGDIPYLAECFIDAYNKTYHKTLKFTPEALDEMEKFEWDGNVRQLMNFCERIGAITKENDIDRAMIKKQIRESFYFLEPSGDEELSYAYKEGSAAKKNMDERIFIGKKIICRNEIADLLRKYNGNRSAVAKELEISRTTLLKYISLLNINP